MRSTKALQACLALALRCGDCGGGRGGVSGPRQGHEVPVLVREGEGLRHGDRGQVQPLLHRRHGDPGQSGHTTRPTARKLKEK